MRVAAVEKTDFGPYRARDLHEGDRYELSEGRRIYCHPAGRDHAGPNATGAAALGSDPAVKWTGVDAGYSPDEQTLRAPDVALDVDPVDDADSGWIRGAPPLAVEYAGRGQDEQDLRKKISELLAAGTRYVWVVRLSGPRRVQVHEPGKPMRTFTAGQELHATGVLQNPVPVDALYDPEAGWEATFRNLLQRKGYESLEAVRIEGRAEGRAEGEAAVLLRQIHDKFGSPAAAIRRRIRTADADTLLRWASRLLSADTVDEIFDS